MSSARAAGADKNARHPARPSTPTHRFWKRFTCNPPSRTVRLPVEYYCTRARPVDSAARTQYVIPIDEVMPEGGQHVEDGERRDRIGEEFMHVLPEFPGLPYDATCTARAMTRSLGRIPAGSFSMTSRAHSQRRFESWRARPRPSRLLHPHLVTRT